MSRLLSSGLAEAQRRSLLSDTQLVLLVGPDPAALRSAAGEAATATGWPLLDLNTRLSEQLIGLMPAERADEAWDAFDRVVDPFRGGVVISGTDILFEPTLGYRPYEALRRMGRRIPIVATWLGRAEDGDLIRSEPGHPEYTRVRLDVPYVAIPSEGESAGSTAISSRSSRSRASSSCATRATTTRPLGSSARTSSATRWRCG